MATNRRCAAIYAGLLGTNLLVAPSNCYAISLESVKQEVLYGYYSPMVFGLAAGVAAGALMARLNKTTKNKVNAQVKTNNTHTSNKASQRGVEGGFGHEVDVPTTSSYVPKHARVTSWDMTGNIRVQKPIVNINFSSEDAYQSEFNTSYEPIETEDKGYARSETSFSNTQVDYEDVAESYVKKQEDEKRSKVRSFGVGRVLAERLGFGSSDIMDGIPVIQRADGSVGDVGTSWWEEAIENSDMEASEDFSDYLGIESDWTAAHPLNITSTDPGTTAASIFVQVAPEVATYSNTTNKASQSVSMQQEAASAYTPSSVEVEELYEVEQQVQRRVVNPMYINKQTETVSAVPHVEQEKYPVADEYKYASREDIWQMALDALDEKIETPIVQDDMFEDVVGNIDTIDDPTGLEPKTSFIPFRSPAGHPEVVDVDSYIDYLIRDEFAKVKSHSVRRNAREYLKVIEGGTSTSNMYIPSHMQQSVQVL